MGFMHRSWVVPLGVVALMGSVGTGALADDSTGEMEGSGDGPQIVSFGDSYFADAAQGKPGLSGCAQGDGNIPRLVAEKLGGDLKDYSCSGAMAYVSDEKEGSVAAGVGSVVPGLSGVVDNIKNMLGGVTGDSPLSPKDVVGGNRFSDQVDMAIKNGDLNEDTDFVPISIGGNDGIFAGGGGLVPEEIQNSGYRKAMGNILPKIKEAAPNAEVVLTGYPKMALADSQMCLPTGTLGFIDSMHLPIPLLDMQESIINRFQEQAADDNGVEFLDLKESTSGHGPCAPPEDRWVSGYMDTTVQSTYAMPLHLTAKANEHISDELVAMYRDKDGSGEGDSGSQDGAGLGQLEDLLKSGKDTVDDLVKKSTEDASSDSEDEGIDTRENDDSQSDSDSIFSNDSDPVGSRELGGSKHKETGKDEESKEEKSSGPQSLGDLSTGEESNSGSILPGK